MFTGYMENYRSTSPTNYKENILQYIPCLPIAFVRFSSTSGGPVDLFMGYGGYVFVSILNPIPLGLVGAPKTT